MKKILLVVFGVFFVFVLLIIASSLQMIRSLPGPEKISQELSKRTLSNGPVIAKTNQAGVQNSNNEPVDIDSQKHNGPLPAQEKKDDEAIEERFQSLMNEELQDTHVCENLGSSDYFKVKNKNSENLSELIFGYNHEDSVAEAVRYPFKAVFHDPEVSSLISEIMSYKTKNLSQADKSSFLTKVGFYSRIASAATHLYLEKEHFEYLANRANHLSVVAKIAALKPNLATDSAVSDFCYQLQGSLIGNLNSDLIEERKELMKLIEYSGLSPQQLDFNPNQFIKFGVNLSNNSISISLSNESSNKKL
ncbi:MAG: hypothetical protein ABL927_01365 [Bdellovibrionales bacterium]